MLTASDGEMLLLFKVVSECFEMGRLPLLRSKLFAFSFFCKPQHTTGKEKEKMNNFLISKTKSCGKRKIPL